jgi:gliding motility-associated-like protein
MMHFFQKLFYFLCSFICLFIGQVNAQCITAFPYHENFETSVGGWTTAGTNNDWVWGTPNKPVITAAGQGLKCWVIGGLNGASYNNGERSWIQSPCFDFTNLPHPYIEFKIFWESEHHYDGSNLQYSTNNGTTWINVGTVNTPVDCYNDNWYNYSSINYLTTLATIKEGWSGNKQATSGSCQGGFGSNSWVVAKHCLSNLAGLTNVIFRFTFGAGTSCNAFDGVAIDDIYIKNAPRNTTNFGFNCTTNSNFSFTDSSTNCPTLWHWNFGDVASGISNTSTLQNPSHHFSTAGIYSVQLIATNTCSGSDTILKTISVLGLTADSVNVSCPNGTNGMAIANIIGANSALTFLWNTSPIQTNDTAFNLAASNYTVTVSEANTCAIATTIHIKQPTNFTHSFTTTSSICGSANGSAHVFINGGTASYNYVWQPSVSVSSIASNIVSGNYTVTIADAKNCIDTMHLFVPNAGGNMNLSIINKKNVSCFNGNDGAATIQIVGGSSPFQFAWNPNVGNTSTINNLTFGNYNITVTDANNCASQIQTTISQPQKLQVNHILKSTSCGKNNGLASLQINGGTKPYAYTWTGNVSNNQQANNLVAGNYFVQINDSNLCTIADTIIINNSTALQIALVTTADTCNTSVGTIFSQINSGTAPFHYRWNSSNSSTSYLTNLAASSHHSVIVTDSNLCTDTASATIFSIGNFLISIGKDTSICNALQPIMLSISNYPSIVWQDGSTKNNYLIAASGQYFVTVKNILGCQASDTINVSEHCNDVLQLPNSFTPNNDGIDDEFGPVTNSPEGLVYYTLNIYNRWGQLVFNSINYNTLWNGKYNDAEQPTGVYVYLVEYSFDKNATHILLKGDVTLLR